MSTDHIYVLHSPFRGGELRHIVHLCDDTDELIDNIAKFLALTGRSPLSAVQMMALAAGPHHPAFEQTLLDHLLTYSPGCPSAVVTRAVEMCIASDMLPPASESDAAIMAALYAAFSTEADWEMFTNAAQIAALSYLMHYDAISENMDEHTHDERMLVCQLSSALCVAMIQARAELQRELTTNGS